FLKIDAGARAGAMAGAFTAVAEDALSIFYNPAGPAMSGGDQVSLAHAEWFEGLRNEHAAYTHAVSGRLSVFAGFAALLSTSLDEYDATGLRTGSYGAMDGAAGVGAAWKHREDLCFGLFAKSVYQRGAEEKAYAYAGDMGVLYNYGGEMRFGAALQNLGTSIRLHRTRFDLPRTWRAGAAYRLERMAWLSAERLKAGGSGAAAALGAEGEYAITGKETVFARLGYKSGRSRNAGSGLSAGLGLRSGSLGVDYAFSPLGDLGDAHRFTLTFKFGKTQAARPERSSVRKAAVKKKARKPAGKPRSKPRSAPAGTGDTLYLIW
ncbi:MAG TPA: PorV/PorQ family protein, partial [Elusimicrobiales bacterium]|nr:PorV/PorQ family protein [Elusimicrobiales bacterium]